ncbi:MAG: alpha/beta fold hydrolase [Xanthobacteraceae bacterium]
MTPDIVATLDRACTRHAVPNGNGDVIWRVWGKGPPLVLLHGGTGSWMHWIRNIEDLSRDYMLLAPDIPGSGESASPKLPTTAEAVGASLVDGVDAIVGRDRSFSIAAFSMGGLISGYTVKHARGRVECLVLIGSTGTTAPRAEMAPLKSWRRLPTDDAKKMAHRHNLGALMFYDKDRIDDIAVYIQHHNAERSRVRGKHVTHTGDLSQSLAGFVGRLAGIWGEHDVTAVPYMAERKEKLEQFRPGATFDVMPGVGHWVQYEAADAFNALLRRRLAPRRS